MHILRCTPEEYREHFPSPSHIFNTVEFNELNRHKCEDVHYLLFNDDKDRTRFGIILGLSDGVLKSPFSAPFGGIEVRGRQRIGLYLEAVERFGRYADDCRMAVQLTLPPSIYDSRDYTLASQFQALMTSGARILYTDYNYHYDLKNSENPIANFWPNTKRNLAASVQNGFTFSLLPKDDKEGQREVYEIVKANHTALGYPVHMSFGDVMAMADLFDIDFFIVRQGQQGVAGGIIYHTSERNVQLIYWGDLLQYRQSRPMNFLSYNIIEHYKNAGYDNFDLGPSSSDGVPSLGLCDFKASFGCVLTPKFTLEL